MGLGIALAALSRAEAITLFPFLAIPFAFLVTRKGGGRVRWKQGFKYGAMACVVGGLLMAPWVAYNLTRFEHPVVLSNGVGSVLMVGELRLDRRRTVSRKPARTGARYHGPYVGLLVDLSAPPISTRSSTTSTRPQRAAYLKEQLGNIPGTDINFFGDESTHEVAWRAVGTGRDQGPPRRRCRGSSCSASAACGTSSGPNQNIFLNGVLEGRGEWQSRLATYEYFPLLALSIVGLVLLRRRRVPILPFLAIAATITITAATSFGITRYRAPVDAMLPVLAGGALVWLFGWAVARFQARGSAPAPLAAQ